jgi:hypothetical protein
MYSRSSLHIYLSDAFACVKEFCLPAKRTSIEVVNNLKEQVCILNVPCADIFQVDEYVHMNCSPAKVHNK